MPRRTLQVAVCGPTNTAQPIAGTLTRLASDLLRDLPDVAVPIFSVADHPSASVSANHHLVVATEQEQSAEATAWTDLSLEDGADVDDLVSSRLVPWVTKWHNNRRAPRAQVAVLHDPDPTWVDTATRLIARLQTHTAQTRVVRIDHIGSTSVSGLKAKNLIDIQIMVPTDQDSPTVAEAAAAAGFVVVAGEWFGKDKSGNNHPETVLVDCDPGRPVNINVRAADVPVAREALLFRDWLGANQLGRQEYEALKLELASSSQDIDEYGNRKEAFISLALARAEGWASMTNWQL